VTKADLIDSLAEKVDLSKRQAGEIVDLILDEIRDSLVKGDKVQLIPFGSFVATRKRARS
jgi:nucleoid DNA-binding protein